MADVVQMDYEAILEVAKDYQTGGDSSTRDR